MDLIEQGILYMNISPVVFQYLNFHIYCGGMCGRVVNTSNSRSTGSGSKPCPSRCFIVGQGTLLHFVSLHPGVN